MKKYLKSYFVISIFIISCLLYSCGDEKEGGVEGELFNFEIKCSNGSIINKFSYNPEASPEGIKFFLDNDIENFVLSKGDCVDFKILEFIYNNESVDVSLMVNEEEMVTADEALSIKKLDDESIKFIILDRAKIKGRSPIFYFSAIPYNIQSKKENKSEKRCLIVDVIQY